LVFRPSLCVVFLAMYVLSMQCDSCVLCQFLVHLVVSMLLYSSSSLLGLLMAQLPVVLSYIVGIVGIINVWVRVFINMGWEQPIL